MSRKKIGVKRPIASDPVFNDFWVAKFVNCVMLNGKKSIVYTHFYAAIEKIRNDKKIASDAELIAFFHALLDKAAPKFVLKSRRFGGSNYQIPVPLEAEGAKLFSIKIMSRIVKDMSGKNLTDRIYGELMNIDKDAGAVIAKKKDIERMAEANKAFSSHFKK